MFINTPFMIPVTYSMTTPQLANALHEYTQIHFATIVIQHNDLIFIGSGGRVITTPNDDKIWRVKTAARASVFYMQNPDRPLESIATSLIKQ